MGDEEMKERDELIAVIIADSFTSTFWPITKDMPKALMPVCNIPLIEYTIELVIRNHIKHIFIFGCSHSSKINKYIQSQKYRSVSIKYFSRPSCTSLGDIMRDLHLGKQIQNDFLMIFGDSVGNANLRDAIDQHKLTRAKDKEYILTVVFSELDVDSKLRTDQEQCVVVLEKSRILQYDQITQAKNVQFNTNVKFKDLREFEIRYDLVESGVIICAPEVMHYFSDNFDYRSLRDHLMRDLLTSEIYTDKFAAYVLPKHHYLQRVHVPRSYDAVSVDIMNRWLYPICLDANLFPPSTPSSYTSSRNNLYKENNVHLARSVKIETPVVIGAGTSMMDGAVVSMSSIGRGCKIGAGTKISNSYIWNNVNIGENCVISHAIICNGVTIGNNCMINTGSIISLTVKINDNVVIPALSRVSKYKYNTEEETYIINAEASEIGEGFYYDVNLEAELKSKFSEQQLLNQSIGGIPDWLELDSEKLEFSDSATSEEGEAEVVHEKFISKESNL